MFAAFADGGREITTEDLIAATMTLVPLVKTMGDKLTELRKFGEARARPASTKKSRFQCNMGFFGRAISGLQKAAALPLFSRQPQTVRPLGLEGCLAGAFRTSAADNRRTGCPGLG